MVIKIQLLSGFLNAISVEYHYKNLYNWGDTYDSNNLEKRTNNN